MQKIEIFVPPAFTKRSLDVQMLETLTDKEWQYSAYGRVSLYHVLNSLGVKKVLTPVYICSSILEPFKKLGIEPIFYDLDLYDLNASLESITFLAAKYQVNTLLVASMYGNPADLENIQAYCRDNNIFMIDDAAQSFGAKLNQKMVGTFGEAGFFSFSPGKPTAGHMGSFFWSSTNIVIKKRQNRLYHYLKWKDFELNRLKIYDDISYRKLFSYIFRIYNRVSNPYHDDISSFENEILGGILYDVLNDTFSYRKQYLNAFKERVHDNQIFRVLDHIRGEASPHKIVLIFYKEDVLEKFQEYLLKWDIFSMKGYRMLSSDLKYLENAKFVENKILEIPIEDDREKMDYLIEKVALFVKH